MADKGLAQYRREIGNYLKYLRFHGLNPVYSFQLDDLCIEYKNHVPGTVPGLSPPTKSKFEKLLAAFEKVCPHMKGDLLVSRAALLNSRVSWSVQHAVPLVPRWATTLCYDLVLHDDVWTAVALRFQHSPGAPAKQWV